MAIPVSCPQLLTHRALCHVAVGVGVGGGGGFREKHQPALQKGGIKLLDHTAARPLATLPAPIVSLHMANLARKGGGGEVGVVVDS